MLFRFSLYGFLKNQRYFEPFLVLAFLEKGLSFFVIGLLVAFREVAVNVMEIPSGAIADVWGRRGSTIVSFLAYAVSFLLFGLATGVPALFAAMFCFAVGEAFRTGTHKAMIFTWLRLQGLTDERSKVYGFTRSWSKLGSSLSVILAAAFVLLSDNYTYIFYISIIPCVASIANLSVYPKELDGERRSDVDLFGVARHVKETFQRAVRGRDLRRLILESMGFGGTFHAAKDYLQPVLKAVAVAAGAQLVVVGDLTAIQRSALLVGPVYLVLHLLSAAASRQAHRVVDAARGEEGASRLLWGLVGVVFAGIALSAHRETVPLLIGAFVLLHVLQNVWRPVLVSRIDRLSNPSQGATVLSMESQARGLATVVMAPLLGYAVDAGAAQGELARFWPVGVLGGLVALGFFVSGSVRARETSAPQRAASQESAD